MIGAVHTYHDGTKHHFHRFARSLGYLDWASQPNPFRSFAGAAEVPLHPRPDAAGSALRNPQSASSPPSANPRWIGDVLRHSLGLSAWKQYRESRWSLRVNPSSGNLHPTEAYVVSGPCRASATRPPSITTRADRHALEQRCAFDPARGRRRRRRRGAWLIALTSIHWREAWKYGERAFRYCQHDLGHAIAAVRIAAALAGWRALMLPDWSHGDIAALTGIDRDEDYVDAEREEPGCLLVIAVVSPSVPVSSPPSASATRCSRRCGRTLDRACESVERRPRAVDVHRRDRRGDQGPGRCSRSFNHQSLQSPINHPITR